MRVRVRERCSLLQNKRGENRGERRSCVWSDTGLQQEESWA